MRELDEFEKETLLRILIIVLACVIVLSFAIAFVFFPSSPSEPSPLPPNHMSPIPFTTKGEIA